MNIEIKNLSKTFRGVQVLDDVNLTLSPGLCGLLGSNGAGKTTLIRILATVLEKSSGEIFFDGKPFKNKKNVRAMIGYVPQEFSFYPNRTVYETLDYFCGLENVNRKERQAHIKKLLERVNLLEQKQKKTKELSGGMRRRLGIAAALIGNPQILLVDEPTVGLDPRERMKFRNILLEFAKDKIVLFSTHIVSDIEETCQKLAIMNEGHVIFEGTQAELLGEVDGWVWEGILSEDAQRQMEEKYLVTGKVVTENGTYVRIVAQERPDAYMKPVKPRIQDAYMYVIESEHSGKE